MAKINFGYLKFGYNVQIHWLFPRKKESNRSGVQNASFDHVPVKGSGAHLWLSAPRANYLEGASPREFKVKGSKIFYRGKLEDISRIYPAIAGLSLTPRWDKKRGF
jgi:hypothetical protein